MRPLRLLPPTVGLILAACLAAGPHATAWQGREVKPLSPTSKKAFQRGLAAAKRQQWEQASRAFMEAVLKQEEGYCYNACPAEVYLNFGLAEARAGHPSQAVGWLATYLVVAPQAPNVAVVRAEVERLGAAADAEIATQIQLIFQEAVETAQRLPSSDDVRAALFTVAVQMARTGYLDEALSTVERAEQEEALEPSRSYMRREYLEHVLLQDDRQEEAQALMAHLTPEDRQRAWSAICSHCIQGEDAACARQALTQIHDEELRDTWRRQLEASLQQEATSGQHLRSPYEIFSTAASLAYSDVRDVTTALLLASTGEPGAVPGDLAGVARHLQECRRQVRELLRLVAIFVPAQP